MRSAGRLPTPPSGQEWQGAQPGQGTSDLLIPGQMQGQAARRQVATAAQSAGPPNRVAVGRWLAG